MKKRFFNTRIGVFSVLLLSVAMGCSPKSDSKPTTDYPAPGTMKLVAVTALDAPPPKSLIENGSFENWYAGAPRPSGPFAAPGDASTITRVKGHSGEVALSQQWSKADDKWGLKGRFTVQLANLEPTTDYTLSFEAKVLSGTPVAFELHGFDDKDTDYPMSRRLFELTTDQDWKEYTTTFSSGIVHKASLVTGCFEVKEGTPQELQIDNIRLTSAGKTKTKPLPIVPPGNVIPNGDFKLWLTGKPLPEGPFSLPNAEAGHSEIMRWSAGNPEDPYKYGLHQIWKKTDATDTPDKLCGVEVNVKNNTDYTLSCSMDTRNKYFAAVSIFGKEKDGAFTPIKQPLFAVTEKKAYGQYSGVFNSGNYSSIKLVTHVPANTTVFPNEAIWYTWNLSEGTEPGK